MGIKISVNNNLSIAKLLEINKNGGRVLKTPHIGNVYVNNLAMIILGIPTLLYDRNIGVKDKNFHPHKIIYNGISEQISSPCILSTHAKVEKQPENFYFVNSIIGKKITDIHVRILRQAIPYGNIFTYTQYLQKNKDIASKIIKEVANEFPELWYRFVIKDGIIEKNTKLFTVNSKIFGLDSNSSGWIIPNQVNILLHCTIDVMRFETNNIYLLSGPDMYKYIKDYEETLNNMYRHIGKKLREFNLPHSVNLNIVPVSKIRFITIKNSKTALNELISLYKKHQTLSNKIKNEPIVNSESKKILIRKRDKIKTKILALLERHYSVFRKMVFYDISSENCFTQYDLIKHKKIYVHPWAINANINEVERSFDLLNRFFNVIKNKKQT